MSLATNIVRRGPVYYVRVAVPTDLKAVVHRREVWKSLGTSDPGKARQIAPGVLRQLQEEWQHARLTRVLTQDDIERAIWDRYQSLIDEDERFRLEQPSEEQLDDLWKLIVQRYGDYDIEGYRIFEIARDAFEHDQERRLKRLVTLKQEAARGRHVSVKPIVDAVIAARRLIVLNSGELSLLAQGLQRAELEALARSQERDQGTFGRAPQDALVRPPKLDTAPITPSDTIMAVYDRFQRERPASASPDTWRQNRKIIVLFAEHVGPGVAIQGLTRKHVRDFKDNLFFWPVKASEAKEFRGKPFRDVIERNKTLEKRTISDKSINKYLSALGGLFRYAIANDYIQDDLLRGMFLDLDRTEKKIFPFSSGQLNIIFRSPLFTGCAGDRYEHQKGTKRIRDWRFWIPLVALFSGARLGEIAQLELEDVRTIRDALCLHIREEGSGSKNVKTRGSERVVPVHSELAQLGFEEFCLVTRKQGTIRLFPELQADARGFASGNASKFFNLYFRKIAVKSDRSHNFHSFRHCIADAFRRAGYLDEQFGVLLGHTKPSTTQKYGILPEGDMQTRIAMINSVQYPDLDLVHLRKVGRPA